MAETEVKVFVSKPDINQMVTISVVHSGKTFTTTIEKIEDERMMKKGIKAMITQLIRYNLGMKRKNACVVVEENQAIEKKQQGRPRTKPITPETESKKEYDRRRYSILKSQKVGGLKELKATA
jgi:hypothetical protein